MKNKNLAIFGSVIFLILVILFFYTNTKPIISEKAEVEILVENLDTPWAIDFLSFGELIFTEREGKVSILDINKKETKVVGNIQVSEVSESGLLGIAVDPQFNSNKFVYLYYTYEDGNRVSRFILDQKLERMENESILIDKIPNARFHDGGRIKFGPDGKLYVTTGDATVPSSAQDLSSLAGKILRMNKDGTVPEDNPYKNLVYSYGHRNPQGIAWNEKGELYASEHGPTRNDEVNIIVKGNNYGWPVECDENSSLYTNPMRCYSELTLAPAGIAFYKDNLYVAGLRGSQLRKLTLDNEKITNEEALFEELGRIREVVEHDGYLYITTSNMDGRGVPRAGDDKIIRIKLS